MNGLDLGLDYSKVVFGENARHVPAWLYIQDQGDGIVSFAGSSKVADDMHPLRYDSVRVHQLILGEIIVRPSLVVGTDALIGQGIGNLLSYAAPMDELLSAGELILGKLP